MGPSLTTVNHKYDNKEDSNECRGAAYCYGSGSTIELQHWRPAPLSRQDKLKGNRTGIRYYIGSPLEFWWSLPLIRISRIHKKAPVITGSHARHAARLRVIYLLSYTPAPLALTSQSLGARRVEWVTVSWTHRTKATERKPQSKLQATAIAIQLVDSN